jgi:hypothetical protein
MLFAIYWGMFLRFLDREGSLWVHLSRRNVLFLKLHRIRCAMRLTSLARRPLVDDDDLPKLNRIQVITTIFTYVNIYAVK